MNLPLPAPRRNWPRRIINTLVALVVLAVTAGTFILSYAGVHAIALKAGVSPQLARFYPGLFDAVLLIACVAAIMLRDAAWWARAWAWAVLIALLAAMGATDAANAMNYALPHPQTEGVVAAAPAAAVLLAFTLLITVLRYSRAQSPGTSPSGPGDAGPAGQPASVAAGATPRQPAPPIALPAANATPPAPAATGEPAPAPATGAAPAADDATGDTAGDTAIAQQDYWDTDVDRQFAGQVYPVLVAEPDDPGGSPGADDEGTTDAAASESAPAQADPDTPPFLAAPAAPAAAAAAAPRLNRARVTPVPPSGEGDQGR